MEMTLNLTYEDGLKVVEAMKEVMKEAAIENCWDTEELDERGIIEEYSRAVDAALAAMGISVNIDTNPSDENEDGDDFDFDDEEEEENDDAIYSLTAKGKFIVQYMEAGYPFEEACKVADILFGSGKDEDEDEDEEENEEEKLPSDEEVINLIMQVLYGQ